MPVAAPKPCGICGVLVRDGTTRCAAHKRKESNFSRRLSRHERGYGSAWDKLRRVILRRDGGACVPCREAGRYTLGNIVDHIKPKAEGGDDEETNLQTICKTCHDRKTALEAARGGGAVQFMPEWLPAPAVPVTVVCGPPGSGKSTFVQTNAAPGDLVLDVDVIAAELTSKPLYHTSREENMAAIRVRNKLLAGLAEKGASTPRAWLIVTAGKPEHREWWRNKLAAELHVMSTPKAECIERIKADARRPEASKRGAIEAVYQWC